MFTELIEEHLQKIVSNIKQDELREAVYYALMGGGKRLRPNFLLLSCASFSSNFKKAINHACAIEMIHAYSLVHDDLPAMDNDDFRRGLPTTHKKFGEDIAILAGDALLNTAFETMINSNNLRATKIITKAAGVSGMIGGQTADILQKSDTFYIHSRKTAALFYAAFYAGAIIGRAKLEEARKLAHSGFLFGLYYQLKDDIDDNETVSKAKPDLILGSCLHIIKNLNLRNDELYEYIRKITKN